MKQYLNHLSAAEKRLAIFYTIFAVFAFLFSFTQIDLGLTLTRSSWIADLQKIFQYIGYFNRPLSTALYLLLLCGSFALYIYTIRLALRKKLTEKALIVLISILTIFLTFSYPLLSHDIFNYIFDAKIVTVYQENPYEHKALDYPTDPMLSFMHWTHRTYPYGPVWLVLTLPFSYLGFGYFLPTFFLFKLISSASYILTSIAAFRLSKKLIPSNPLVPVVLLALNPLVLFEILITGHNDLVMMAFALFSFYYLFEKRYITSSALLLLSVGIKFATVLLLPIFVVFPFLQKAGDERRREYAILLSILLMISAIIIASLRTNFQPWYLLYLLPFAVFRLGVHWIVPIVTLSVMSLFVYVPYLYLGTWDQPVSMILNGLYALGLILAVVSFIVFRKRF